MKVSRNQLIVIITLLAVSRYFYCDSEYYKKNPQKSCYFDSKAAEGIKMSVIIYMLLIILVLQVFPTNVLL